MNREENKNSTSGSIGVLSEAENQYLRAGDVRVDVRVVIGIGVEKLPKSSMPEILNCAMRCSS